MLWCHKFSNQAAFARLLKTNQKLLQPSFYSSSDKNSDKLDSDGNPTSTEETETSLLQKMILSQMGSRIYPGKLSAIRVASTRQFMSSHSQIPFHPFHPFFLQILRQHEDPKHALARLRTDPWFVELSGAEDPGFVKCFSYKDLRVVFNNAPKLAFEEANLEHKLNEKILGLVTPYTELKGFFTKMERNGEVLPLLPKVPKILINTSVEDILYSNTKSDPIQIHRILSAWNFPIEPLLSFSSSLTLQNSIKSSGLGSLSPALASSNFPLAGKANSLMTERLYPNDDHQERQFSSVLKKRRLRVKKDKRKRRRKLNRMKTDKNKT